MEIVNSVAAVKGFTGEEEGDARGGGGAHRGIRYTSEVAEHLPDLLLRVIHTQVADAVQHRVVL